MGESVLTEPTARRLVGWRAVARRWLRSAVVVLVAMLGVQLFARRSMSADIATSFQVQYLIAATVLMAGLLVVRARLWLMVAAVPLAVSLWNVAPWYVGGRRSAPTEPRLRVMLFNVLQTNDDATGVIQEVRNQNPDVLVVLECDIDWFTRLEPLRSEWKHAEHCPGARLRGTAVFSRLPLEGYTTLSLNNPYSRSLSFQLTVSGRPLSVFVTHPWPPVRRDAWESRNAQLLEAASVVKSLPGPKLLLGDFNLTMWSPFYRDLESISGLRNARKGFGVVPTFPMDRTILLHVPIDHVLVSDDVAVDGCRRGQPHGSDHAPVIVDLGVPLQAGANGGGPS